MLDDHLTRDGEEHNVNHRVDGVAGDHLDQLDADDDQAGRAHACLQIRRITEQLVHIGHGDHADAGHNARDQDHHAKGDLNRCCGVGELVSKIRIHGSLPFSTPHFYIPFSSVL